MIKSCLKTRKSEDMETKEILHKSAYKRLFRNGNHSSLRRADTSSANSYVAHAAYRYFAGQA